MDLESTISELQRAMASGVFSARDLVAACLARIDAYDQQGPSLNAISCINPRALDEADGLDTERRARGPRGPLHGIPIVVKDNYETHDMQTAAGSALMKGWIPPADAFLVGRLRRAGAIIIGKSTMHEWAWSWETSGSLFGQTRNPYALDRVPGGSSGGSGAAVAASFAIAGLGSDTCGSIRVPAAVNSLTGIRGTRGLLSRSGIVPLSHTQDIGGPMCHNMTDLAITLDALVGYDAADPETAASVGKVPASYTDSLRADGLRGARVGLLTNLLTADPADPGVIGVVRAAGEAMRRQGAQVLDVSIDNLAGMFDASGVIWYEFKFDLDTYLDASPSAPVRSLEAILASGTYDVSIEPALKRSQDVETLETHEYYRALATRRTLRLAALTSLAEHNLDALIYPTVRVEPVSIGAGRQTGVNCSLSAQSGLPALTVPAGFTASGLPVGLELLGRAWSEPRLIELAYAFEQATQHRRPPASTPVLDLTAGAI